MSYQIPQKTLDRCFAFTGPFEGNIPHFYRDSVGLVTVGIGFMLPTLTAAQAIGMQPADKVAADFAAVSAAPLGRVAAFYKQFTSCTLPPELLRAEFDKRMQAFATTLISRGWDFTGYPAEAMIVLLDLAYNLGAGGVLKFKKLRSCMDAADWIGAAGQCTRKGVSSTRNKACQDLLTKISTPSTP